MKRKRSLCEASVVITALACLTAVLLLPLPIVQAATELRLNETVIPMIETVEPSREADIMLYSEREEAGVYENTPEVETASELQNMTVVDDKAVETVQTEWAQLQYD